MNWTKILIYSHAIFGGIALAAGLASAISVKGSKFHKRMGSIFHHSMVISILISLMIAILPAHFNPFLFGIGVFSIYSVIMGKRCLKFTNPNHNLYIDKLLAYILLFNCFLMIGIPFILNGKLNIILAIFGAIGILFGTLDLRLYLNPEQMKADRLKLHINKMSGGYIAAVTAFLVVNELLPGYWAWFTPTILGSLYATYYNVKIRNRKT